MCFWCLFVDVLAAWFASHVSLVSGLVSQLVFQIAFHPQSENKNENQNFMCDFLQLFGAVVFIFGSQIKNGEMVRKDPFQRPPTASHEGIKFGHCDWITWNSIVFCQSVWISKLTKGSLGPTMGCSLCYELYYGHLDWGHGFGSRNTSEVQKSWHRTKMLKSWHLSYLHPDFSIGDQHSTRPSHFGLHNCLKLLEYTRMFGHKDNTITF